MSRGRLQVVDLGWSPKELERGTWENETNQKQSTKSVLWMTKASFYQESLKDTEDST